MTTEGKVGIASSHRKCPEPSLWRHTSVQSGCNPTVAMHALSPARRVRRTFMRLGQSIAIIAFLAIAGDVLFEQWIAGYASAFFIFGTACLIAAACTALFAIIAGIGLVASSAFRDDPPGMGPQHHER